MGLIQITEEADRGNEPRLTNAPLWRLAFRPFYLLGAAFAAIAIPMWLARYYGQLPGLRNVDFNWHMHEMVFGFAAAIVIGFLYTAGRNWTNLWTPRGKPLAALAGLWVAGRIAMLFGSPPVAALFDIAFVPVAAWMFYQVLRQVPSKRNMVMVGLLGLLTVANAAFHASALGWLDIPTITSIHAAILVIVMIEAIIGGRVIPMFTANASAAKQLGLPARMERMTAIMTTVASIAWVAGIPAMLFVPVALVAAVLQAARLASWKPWHTLKTPLLWILHAAYAFIPLGFGLLALASLQWVPASAAIHALAVGSMAGLIMGMMTRTALGHTARPLKAGPKETVMYVLILAGALTRLVASLSGGELREATMVISGVCWSLAFLLYVLVYVPYLSAPRLDGKDG